MSMSAYYHTASSVERASASTGRTAMTSAAGATRSAPAAARAAAGVAPADHKKSQKSVKVIIVGASGVGKTSLVKRFVGQDPAITTWQQTDIQYISLYRPRSLDDGTAAVAAGPTATEEVRVEIWDTAGQERFVSVGVTPVSHTVFQQQCARFAVQLTRAFFRGADAVVVVVDVTDPDSVPQSLKWKAVAQEEAPDVPIQLLFNKWDGNRMLSNAQLDMLAEHDGVTHTACVSAKTGHNVVETMTYFIFTVYDDMRRVEAATAMAATTAPSCATGVASAASRAPCSRVHTPGSTGSHGSDFWSRFRFGMTQALPWNGPAATESVDAPPAQPAPPVDLRAPAAPMAKSSWCNFVALLKMLTGSSLATVPEAPEPEDAVLEAEARRRLSSAADDADESHDLVLMGALTGAARDGTVGGGGLPIMSVNAAPVPVRGAAPLWSSVLYSSVAADHAGHSLETAVSDPSDAHSIAGSDVSVSQEPISSIRLPSQLRAAAAASAKAALVSAAASVPPACVAVPVSDATVAAAAGPAEPLTDMAVPVVVAAEVAASQMPCGAAPEPADIVPAEEPAESDRLEGAAAWPMTAAGHTGSAFAVSGSALRPTAVASARGRSGGFGMPVPVLSTHRIRAELPQEPESPVA